MRLIHASLCYLAFLYHPSRQMRMNGSSSFSSYLSFLLLRFFLRGRHTSATLVPMSLCLREGSGSTLYGGPCLGAPLGCTNKKTMFFGPGQNLDPIGPLFRAQAENRGPFGAQAQNGNPFGAQIEAEALPGQGPSRASPG